VTGMDLKLERTRLNLRQWRVANALDMNPADLSRIENGHKPVKQDDAARILSAMHRMAGKDEPATAPSR